MPVPALIIDRELALDRDVTPDDFTESERGEILELLPRCLQEAHRSLDIVKVAGGPILGLSMFKAAEWVGVLEDLYEVFSNANAETQP